MALNSDIRDQAYQFFIEEAPELLQAIESGLLTLKEDRSTTKVHEIMRAAHSLKGGAASVELNAIKKIAHRLEDAIKAFYSETVEIDTELESLFLQAYDCLRNPLIEQIEVGSFDEEAALQVAEPIFEKIEYLLKDSLLEAERYIPSSSDLGIDIVSSIFEVDVAQGLERLTAVLANPQNFEVAGELRAQAEVFVGFAELLGLPGFGEIAQVALQALERYPNRVLEITQLALADWQVSREQVLGGDRDRGGNPSPALRELSQGLAAPSLEIANGFEYPEFVEPQDIADNAFALFESPELSENAFALFEESEVIAPPSSNEENAIAPQAQNGFDTQSLEAFWDTTASSSIDDIFGAVPPAIEETTPQEFVPPSVDDVFGAIPPLSEEATSTEFIPPSVDDVFGAVELANETTPSPEVIPVAEATPTEFVPPSVDEIFAEPPPITAEPQNPSENLEAAIHSVEQIFDRLPLVEENLPSSPAPVSPAKEKHPELPGTQAAAKAVAKEAAGLSIRVDFNRLERMNNLVGELSINRNSQSLQNEQIQTGVKELLNRFARFQKMTGKLRELSDQVLVKPMNAEMNGLRSDSTSVSSQSAEFRLQNLAEFDALEMDSYGAIYSLLQGLLEEMIQLEEAVDDIVLFARNSDRTLEQQRQMLTNLRDELMWARMLPLGEVLNRFPRTLRDLSATYHKPVKLKLSGTGVLVDKAALEKLYDPLLHLLRNAFDHGIEPPDIRKAQGKAEEGQIEIKAYHQGNQTIIEIKDDGRGLNLEKIGQKAVNIGLVTSEELAVMSEDRIAELIFEPGFSTASQVSELSGRGVGLDVVRSQLRSLKGTVTVNHTPGKGTIFTLRLPLTLTISKLLVCLVNQEMTGQSTAVALPSDSIEEIVIPTQEQIKKSGSQRFLHLQRQIIPVYRLSELLVYKCALSEVGNSKALTSVPTPDDWALPLLLLRRGQQLFALEVNRLVSEQELVVKPFGSAIASPSYTYGCTILGDGTLIPAINGAILLDLYLEPDTAKSTPKATFSDKSVTDTKSAAISQARTILVVDDSATLRRTLALTLQKAGYRVIQARDGREALEQLQQNPGIQLTICDVEMPNMNGFEFLGQRRREPEFAKIPVAMLTSRSSDKHRQLAMHLGASAYFTKPFIEQQFIAAINNILSENSSQALPALR